MNIKESWRNISFTDNDNRLNCLYGRVTKLTHRPNCIRSWYSCTDIGKHKYLNAQMLTVRCVKVARFTSVPDSSCGRR
jgi:hypothetical protein